MRLRSLAAVVAAVFVAASANIAQAQHAKPSLFIHTGPGLVVDYSHLRYEGRDWTVMTQLLKGSFAITTGAMLPGIAALASYDALWIDQRYGTKPTQADLNTMLAFAATGRRVVIVGENSYPWDLNFYNWSAPFVAALGGTQGLTLPNSKYSYAGADIGCVYGPIKSIYKHELAWNLENVNTGCAGFAVGGTALFDYNAVTLWGVPQNVLTILDTNILDDPFGADGGSPRFRKNLVQWLGDSELSAAVTTVPEPATFALFAPALIGIAMVLRRRRKTA